MNLSQPVAELWLPDCRQAV